MQSRVSSQSDLTENRILNELELSLVPPLDIASLLQLRLD